MRRLPFERDRLAPNPKSVGCWGRSAIGTLRGRVSENRHKHYVCDTARETRQDVGHFAVGRAAAAKQLDAGAAR